MDPSEPSQTPVPTRIDRKAARTAGLVGICVSLAILWAVSGIVHQVAFPPTAIAGAVVRATPGGIATFFIDLLRHWALRLLAFAVLFLTVGVGAYIPVLTSARGRIRPFVAGSVLFVLASLGALVAPGETNVLATIGTAAVASLAYIATMGRLYARAVVPHRTDAQRRQMLRMGAVGGLSAAFAGGVIGWAARRLMGPNRDVFLVAPSHRATEPSRAPFPDVPGQSPEITPVKSHYVVDIDLVSPLVEAQGWKVPVTGLVDKPLELTFEGLQRDYEVVEDYSVLTCISNEVGGPLIGNSAWGGVRLRDILKDAGTHTDAMDVVFTAADGYTDSIPVEIAMDPIVILAVSHDGQPLTQDHGFPCRVRVPAIYGMKNVKWLRKIEVVGRNYKGYWEQRGWSDDATIRTESRIDVVGDNGSVKVGTPSWVAGVAWAGVRGISKVEVSTDGGESWSEARLKDPLSDLSWRLWAYQWTPETSGRARVVCRATDGDGSLQTSDLAAPHPAGATGWHMVDVSVDV